MNLQPHNRYIVLNPYSEKQDENKSISVLVPEAYLQKQVKDEYSIWRVEAVSSDCKTNVRKGEKILVEGNMVKEITVHNKKYFMVLENYVIASLTER